MLLIWITVTELICIPCTHLEIPDLPSSSIFFMQILFFVPKCRLQPKHHSNIGSYLMFLIKTKSLWLFVNNFFYPAPGRGTGYCFRAISFFLSMFLCQQHYEKTAGPICMKFSGKVWSDYGTTWLNFGSIRVNGSAGQRSICLLSPAIAQRTWVNKSVSFTRWQQGAGFVVPRTTAC